MGLAPASFSVGLHGTSFNVRRTGTSFSMHDTGFLTQALNWLLDMIGSPIPVSLHACGPLRSDEAGP